MDFKNAKELLELSQNEKLTISEVMRQRELSETENSPEELYTKMERVLEIMKDSRLGTFGGAALFFILALKAAALGALAGTFQADGSGPDAFAPLLLSCCLAGTLARCMVFAAMRVPSARPGGLGEALHEGVTSRHELIALAIGLGICAVNGVRGLYALAIALLAAYLLLSAAKKRLGGVTGDVFGCLVELTECVVLIVCCV